jgi:hypothetical protein
MVEVIKISVGETRAMAPITEVRIRTTTSMADIQTKITIAEDPDIPETIVDTTMGKDVETIDRTEEEVNAQAEVVATTKMVGVVNHTAGEDRELF